MPLVLDDEERNDILIKILLRCILFKFLFVMVHFMPHKMIVNNTKRERNKGDVMKIICLSTLIYSAESWPTT